jgi:two-component system sensor histidine kinase UhpB
VLRDAAGRAVRMTGAMQDITVRNQAMVARAESEMRYRTLFEYAPDGILIVGSQGRILDANVSGCQMLGNSREQLLRATVSEMVPPEEFEHIEEAQARLKQKDFRYHREWRLRRADGSIFPAEVIATTMPDGNVLVVARETTDRKEAEAVAKLLTQRLALATDAAAVGIWDWDLKEDRWYATPVYSKMLGYDPDEAPGDRARWLERVHPDDQMMVRGKIEALLAGSEEPYHYEARIRHANGSYRWMAVSGRVLAREEDGRPRRILGVRMDITERKRSETELSELNRQLRALALRLETFRERERTSIAREIHDVLAQELTRLKIDLVWIAKRVALPVDEPIRVAVVARVGDAITQSDTAISTVQRIATELRPVILDSLGLPAAVEWQAEDFARRTAIACRAKAFPGETKLPRERATAVFRILQESLTNVARHASASEVEVELVEQDGVATLTVRDNGVGISPDQLQDPHSIGLLGMKERALAFDGSVEISSQPNGGTTVTVKLPVSSS